jgi:hypothetical protein
MGQEVLYCSTCQVRVVGGDFEKGEAYRVGDNVACRKCAMGMLATAPLPQQQQILDQRKKALDKKTGANPAVARGLTGSSTAVRTAKVAEAPKLPLAVVAGIVAVLLIVLGILMMSGRTPPPPPPRPVTPPPVVLPVPAPKDTAAEAKREAEAAERKRKEQVAAEQTALLSRAREMGVNAEYQTAADLLADGRKKYPDPDWTKPIDDRIQELEKTMAAEFPALRDRAVEARKRDGTSELALIREMVAHWGSARYTEELEKSLAAVFPPVKDKGGVLKLEVADATMQGNNKFKRTTGDWKIIQYWYHPKDYLEWTAQPRQAGVYTVRMNYALPKEMNNQPVGGEVEMIVSGSESKRFVVVPTNGWGDFKTITFDTITLPSTTCTITIRPVKIQQALFSLRFVELVPAK